MGSLTYGYCTSIITTTLGQSSFLSYIGLDTAPNATQLIGAINGLYQAGSLPGAIFVGVLGDWLGRALVTLTTLWQSEMAPPETRGLCQIFSGELVAMAPRHSPVRDTHIMRTYETPSLRVHCIQLENVEAKAALAGFPQKQQQPPRQRVSLACTTCRAKRTRVSVLQVDPPFVYLGTELCQSAMVSFQNAVPVSEQEDNASMCMMRNAEKALHSRIETLERQLQQYHQATVDGKMKIINPSTLASPISSLNRPKYDAELIPDDDEPGVSPENQRDPVDDLTDIYGRLDVAEDGHLRYFGASSYFNMLKRPQYDGSTAKPHVPSLSSTAFQAHMPTRIDLPHEVQNHLLDLYWKWQNPWQYIVHKDAFCRALEQGHHDEYCTPLLLHSVLALAARYSDDISLRTDPLDANTAGDALQRTAKFILQSEVEHPTVSTVVSLAILALREMSTNKEAIGWTYIGIAVRIAYNLGLNLDCTPWLNKNLISEEEAEIRKIAWWGCYLLDKLFNIGLGRPGMIKEWDITALRPSLLRSVEFSPWEIHEEGLNISIPMSRSISNMHYMCEIFRIVSNALDQIFLKLPSSAKTPRPAHSYSLHLQYHTVTILLHRPFLRRREQSTLSDLVSLTDLTHNQICTASAEAISSVLRAYRTHYTLRRIPISTVHAVGTGSVVHLLDATSQDPIMSRTAIRLLKFNLTCLKEMSTAWTWGLRAIRSLQILAEGWAVNELLHAQGDRPSATQNTLDSNLARGSNQSNSAASPLDSHLQNIDWLLDFDSGLDHEPTDIYDSNNGFWAMIP
ncbi:hypothetical protein UA08_02149 [Talaromyces atroroseus]|uniref:Xylanolytic transcriptional activator regulatory domain-containing protein n=1 Tax=Talaromyces atroroseus TaxID=1441469 RepID=A0A225ARC5_TALAT|nr:hypothetical protein UA08_02149 [Talaromyces atroroseus]OKL62053.1 hypothetical protein UA08_02149 [Talaromyces atroroseus]